MNGLNLDKVRRGRRLFLCLTLPIGIAEVTSIFISLVTLGPLPRRNAGISVLTLLLLYLLYSRGLPLLRRSVVIVLVVNSFLGALVLLSYAVHGVTTRPFEFVIFVAGIMPTLLAVPVSVLIMTSPSMQAFFDHQMLDADAERG